MNQYNNDLFDKSTKWKIFGGVLGALAGGVLVIGLVVFMNNQTKENTKRNALANATNEKVVEENTVEDIPLESSGLTSKDLDFWNIYDEKEEKNSVLDDSDFTKKSSSDSVFDNKANKDDNIIENSLAKNNLGSNVKAPDEKSENQFNLGTEDNPEYTDILESALKNNYVASNFKLEGDELSYYSSNRKISSYGVDVSKYQGNIDWQKVAACGIDFAMIRMGVRGYSSGAVVVDENFSANMNGAIANGIDVGIYFYSQAVTVEEAIEEANYAVAAIQGYAVSYPIAFYTESIENETARTDELTPEQLTEIAKAFTSTVEGYGYRSIICGNKKQLSQKLLLEELSDKTYFLIDPLAKSGTEDMTLSDYPYQYSMWQYSSVGKIDGIDGNVNLDISFVDYMYR